MKPCLSSLIYYLQQFRSSLISPQSLSPSHFHSVRTQRWLSQVNSVGRQVGCVQFACSSEPSPQSSSRSQTNRSGMHRVLLQENLSAPHPGTDVALNESQIQSLRVCNITYNYFNVVLSAWCFKPILWGLNAKGYRGGVFQGISTRIVVGVKGKVCVRAKWPIRRELIPVSVA